MIIPADQCAFALARAKMWRDQAEREIRPSAVKLCRGNDANNGAPLET
jgi:hypothetical protein